MEMDLHLDWNHHVSRWSGLLLVGLRFPRDSLSVSTRNQELFSSLLPTYCSPTVSQNSNASSLWPDSKPINNSLPQESNSLGELCNKLSLTGRFGCE